MLISLAALVLAGPAFSQVVLDLPVEPLVPPVALTAVTVPSESMQPLSPDLSGSPSLAAAAEQLSQPERAPEGESAPDPRAGVAPEVQDLFDKLYMRLALTEAERTRFEKMADRAVETAFDSRLPEGARIEGITFLAQTALLSFHDLATHRIAEDRLIRLKFSLARIRMEAEDAWNTVNRHLHVPISDGTRSFLIESVLRSPFAR